MKKNKPRTYSLFIVFFTISVISLVILVVNLKDKDKVCFETTCFRVEKAITPEQRAIGLMNRNFLADNEGMIFIFEKEGTYAFWMKNTTIPLDMIWLNSTEDVVYIFKNATPCLEICTPIVPDKNATYVLEINAGLAEKYSIDVGEKAKIY